MLLAGTGEAALDHCLLGADAGITVAFHNVEVADDAFDGLRSEHTIVA